MINCGHCKGKHKTVVEVRECSLRAHRPNIADWSALKPGRYAVYLPSADEPGGEKLRFFIVSERRRISEQAGPNIYPVPTLPVSRRAAIIKEILRKPEEAMIRYGKELGYCGKCGRELTNETSRQMGIGPKCGGRG